MIDSTDRRLARIDASRDHDFVERLERGVVRGSTEVYLNLQALQPLGVIADRFGEFLLAGNRFREIELAAKLRRCFEQGDLVSAFGGDRRARKSGRATADHRDLLPLWSAPIQELSLSSGARVDDAVRGLTGEVVVETGLVAGDADVDGRAVSGFGLAAKFRVGEQRARHGHEVRVAAR